MKPIRQNKFCHLSFLRRGDLKSSFPNLGKVASEAIAKEDGRVKIIHLNPN